MKNFSFNKGDLVELNELGRASVPVFRGWAGLVKDFSDGLNDVIVWVDWISTDKKLAEGGAGVSLGKAHTNIPISRRFLKRLFEEPKKEPWVGKFARGMRSLQHAWRRR